MLKALNVFADKLTIESIGAKFHHEGDFPSSWWLSPVKQFGNTVFCCCRYGLGYTFLQLYPTFNTSWKTFSWLPTPPSSTLQRKRCLILAFSCQTHPFHAIPKATEKMYIYESGFRPHKSLLTCRRGWNCVLEHHGGQFGGEGDRISCHYIPATPQ